MSGFGQAPAWASRLQQRLHHLDAPPVGMAGNHGDICDLIPEGSVPRPAGVLVPLRPMANGSASVLLTRRADDLLHHPGQISFPGGRVESGDISIVAAALREAREEIGLGAENTRALGCLDPLLTVTGFHVQPVVAMISSDFVPHIDVREVAEAFEVPLDFLLDPDNARSVQARYRGRMRRWHEFHYRGHRIWGVTAAIILDLRCCMEEEAQ